MHAVRGTSEQSEQAEQLSDQSGSAAQAASSAGTLGSSAAGLALWAAFVGGPHRSGARLAQPAPASVLKGGCWLLRSLCDPFQPQPDAPARPVLLGGAPQRHQLPRQAV